MCVCVVQCAIIELWLLKFFWKVAKIESYFPIFWRNFCEFYKISWLPGRGGGPAPHPDPRLLTPDNVPSPHRNPCGGAAYSPFTTRTVVIFKVFENKVFLHFTNLWISLAFNYKCSPFELFTCTTFCLFLFFFRSFPIFTYKNNKKMKFLFSREK